MTYYMPCLLRALTWFFGIYLISAVNIVARPRGLIILSVDWLEDASSSVQNPVLGSRSASTVCGTRWLMGLFWERGVIWNRRHS
jgi:hypothetical protein